MFDPTLVDLPIVSSGKTLLQKKLTLRRVFKVKEYAKSKYAKTSKGIQVSNIAYNEDFWSDVEVEITFLNHS